MAKLHEILVVDDDPDIRDSLQIVLEHAGYEVRTAANGKAALEELRKSLPDAMILDIMMTTETEGFDLAYEVQETPEFANLPILLVTSFLDRVREGGPEAFQHVLGEQWPARWLFEKPLEPEKLLKKLASILQGE